MYDNLISSRDSINTHIVDATPANLKGDTEEDVEKKDEVNKVDLAYLRKHPNLQGWMERLWVSRGNEHKGWSNFNGVELELTWEDARKRCSHIAKVLISPLPK